MLLAARATGLPNPSVANVTELVTLDRALRTFFTIAADLPPVAIEYMEGTPDWPPMLAVAHTAAYDVALTGHSEVPADRLAMLRLPVLVVRGGASFPWIGRDGPPPRRRRARSRARDPPGPAALPGARSPRAGAGALLPRLMRGAPPRFAAARHRDGKVGGRGARSDQFSRRDVDNVKEWRPPRRDGRQ